MRLCLYGAMSLGREFLNLKNVCYCSTYFTVNQENVSQHFLPKIIKLLITEKI